MDISEYYNRAKAIGSRQEYKMPELLDALNYSEEHDRPSSWAPNVQTAIMNQVKDHPNDSDSNEFLELYIQGEIMKSSYKKNTLVKVGSCCFLAYLFIGWLSRS